MQKRYGRGVQARLCALALLSLPVAARAGECPVPAGAAPALGARSDRERLDFLRDRLDREQARVRTWNWSWRAAYGALVVGQAIPGALVHDRGLRIDLLWGAASAVPGLLFMTFAPLELDPPAAPDGSCATLEREEQRLASAARAEAGNVDWTFHAGNLAINAAFALVLGLGYGRWQSAALNFVPGFLIGELNALTQPRRAPDDLAHYREGRLLFVPAPGGGVVALRRSF